MTKKKLQQDNLIAINRKATHDYSFVKHYEAGIVLEGWEVKSLRAKKVQLVDSYAIIKNQEIWLLGTLITPLTSTCTHTKVNPTRTRKLLMHRKEINNLVGLTKQRGFTLIPKKLFWHQDKIKIEIGLAKGKKLYDKRATAKEQSWKLAKQRLLKSQPKK